VKLLEDARPNDGFGTTGQPDAALLPWPYEAKNQLYYHKEGLPFSEKELTEQVQVPSPPHPLLHLLLPVPVLIILSASQTGILWSRGKFALLTTSSYANYMWDSV